MEKNHERALMQSSGFNFTMVQDLSTVPKFSACDDGFPIVLGRDLNFIARECETIPMNHSLYYQILEAESLWQDLTPRKHFSPFSENGKLPKIGALSNEVKFPLHLNSCKLSLTIENRSASTSTACTPTWALSASTRSQTTSSSSSTTSTSGNPQLP
jgi:hypothetical protein